MKIVCLALLIHFFSLNSLAADSIAESVLNEHKQRELAKLLVNKDETGLKTFLEENLKSIEVGTKSQKGFALSKSSILIVDDGEIRFLECLNENCGSNRPYQKKFDKNLEGKCTRNDVRLLSPLLASFEVYKDTPTMLCAFGDQQSAFIKMKKNEDGNYVAEKTEADVLAAIPQELQTSSLTKFIADTFIEIKTKSEENSKNLTENKKIDKMKNDGVGIFSKSTDPSCAFQHELADKTFSAVHLWLKKILGLNEKKAQYAFEIWNDYIQYEHARQTGAVVLKKIKKPDLVVVHISTWADRETLQKTAESKFQKMKLEKLSAAMSLQGQGDFIFFEDYKTVPCGIVAMDFKDVVYAKDIGMVVRGARFYPAKMK